MALPTVYATAEGGPDVAASIAFQVAKNLRAQAVLAIAEIDAGSLNLDNFAQVFLRNLWLARTRWPVLLATPGLLIALQRLFPNKTIVQADLNSVLPAINTLIAAVEAGCPVDASGWILSLKLLKDGTGATQQRQITSAPALASFRASLVTFRDAFDGTP